MASGLIGVIGGIVDLIAGGVLLQSSMRSSYQSGMMANGQNMVAESGSSLGGYFLIAFGLVVVCTGGFLLTAKGMRKSGLVGRLMVVYGVIMLLVAATMFAQLFSMMQGAYVSGTAMLLIGFLMLYSGLTMKGM